MLSIQDVNKDQLLACTNLTLKQAFKEYFRLNPNKPLIAAVLTWDEVLKIIENQALSDWLEPTTALEVLKTGNVGTMLGVQILTDAFLPQEEQWVKNPISLLSSN